MVSLHAAPPPPLVGKDVASQKVSAVTSASTNCLTVVVLLQM